MSTTTTRRAARTPEASAELWVRIARRAADRAAARAWPADADAGLLPEALVAAAAAAVLAALAAL